MTKPAWFWEWRFAGQAEPTTVAWWLMGYFGGFAGCAHRVTYGRVQRGARR